MTFCGESMELGRYPLIKEVSTPLTAPQAFGAFKDRPFPFFLDSGMDPVRLGRYSFIGSDPFQVLRARGREVTLRGEGGEKALGGDPFQVLEGLMERYWMERSPSPVPFVGGAVGYFSYDLCHFIERLPAAARDDLGLPEGYLGFYDALLAFDHQERRAYLLSTGLPEEGAGREERARGRLEELERRLLKVPPPEEEGPLPGFPGGMELRSNFTHQGYLEAVEAAREYIAAGDIFQVNLSQRFEADWPFSPYWLYQRLRRINPAPFACYLDFGEVAVVSASPERFLRLRGELAETRPIKGTRPRGGTRGEDEALARELRESLKDQAEHVMIVDLERNDLGRVCRFGTVRVSELMALETYPTVFHLTSTIEGQLKPGKKGFDLLRACFPGGSITGAPKVRAMEIIDELEPTRRSIYTGSIGYLGFNGDLDLNIAIRTFILKGGKAYFQVGGAIVYDSDPEAEYQETLDKAKALIQALRMAPQSALR